MRLFGFLRARRKRDTIKKYITILGPLLRRRYGKSEHYSPEQVREAIQDSGLPADQVEYALVLYCTPESFVADQAALGGEAGYWQLRVEIVGYAFRHKEVRGPGGGSWEGSMADYGAWFCSSGTNGLT